MKIKVNLRNHGTRNTIGQYLSLYIYFHHFENEHHLSLKVSKMNSLTSNM